MKHPNLAAMFRTKAAECGPKVALRRKYDGLYHDVSYADYRRWADQLALGLQQLGVRDGDRVAILSENRLEWLLADAAILSLGAVDVPMHAPLVASQVAYQLLHSGSRGVVVSNQLQADKVAAALPEVPNLEFIVSAEPIVWAGPIPHYTVAGLIHRGGRAGAAAWNDLIRHEATLAADHLATIIYTSGTTGLPKGVVLTHGNILSNVEAMLECSVLLPDDILLSWLPYSHIYARTVDVYLPLRAESMVCLAESMDTLVRNLAETQPTWMTAVPRFYEKVWAAVEALPPPERSARLKAIFGRRLRWLSSGGAPLPVHVGQGYWDAGIQLVEGYGLTETSPVISFNRRDRNRVGTVGPLIPGVEVKIAPDGEILTRGPHVMLGYWRDPEATKAVIDPDGWFHTGDIGKIDADGFLAITDRKKDLIVTSGGKNIAPAEIERLLVSEPLIDQAVICGDRRPFVTAILVPNFPLLEALATSLGVGLDVRDGFITNPKLHAAVAERVAHCMAAVSQPERVRKFLLLARPLRIEDEELTPTQKVRRRAVLAKFAAAFDKLYHEAADAAAGP